MKVIPIILSGGSGTRLWPLSRRHYPKQFLNLYSDMSMFQETLLRLKGVKGLSSPIVVCNEEHRFFVAEQLREIDSLGSIILEPSGRNTAPAIALAALLAKNDPLLLVFFRDLNFIAGGCEPFFLLGFLLGAGELFALLGSPLLLLERDLFLECDLTVGLGLQEFAQRGGITHVTDRDAGDGHAERRETGLQHAQRLGFLTRTLLDVIECFDTLGIVAENRATRTCSGKNLNTS